MVAARHAPMTGKITIEQKWHGQSEAAKNKAERLPHGKERDAELRPNYPDVGRPSRCCIKVVMKP
jgi:hypothetical protein